MDPLAPEAAGEAPTVYPGARATLTKGKDTMRPSIIALLALMPLGALAVGHADQDEGPAPADDRELPTPPRELNSGLLARMQGCWRLTDASISGLHAEGRKDSAILLVSEEFMSIEMHIAYHERDEQVDEILQTGTHRLHFNHAGYLDTTVLIGSLGDEGEFTFLPTGEQGSYRVLFASEQLILTNRHDGSRFTFVKIASSPGYEGDFFGRRAAPEPDPGDGRR